MVKKAELDIQEIAVDEDGLLAEAVPDPEAEGESGAAAPRADGKARVKGQRILWWALGTGLALLGATAGWWAVAQRGNEAPPPAGPRSPALEARPLPVAGNMALLEGLIVDQTDERGDLRVLFCDLALELASPEMAKTAGERMEVRAAVYDFLRREVAREGLTRAGRERIKTGITSGLNQIMGENGVKTVYFMHYELR